MEHRHANVGRLLHAAGGYDVLLALITFGRERKLREKMLAAAHLQLGESVLDVGCGTGTLALLAKEQVGAGEVRGVDASPEMVARAQRKAGKSGVEFSIAAAQQLPFPDGRFDVVLSTLMLHHLARPARHECLREVKRVLKPSGRVLIVDFETSAKPRGVVGLLHRRHGHVAADDVATLLQDEGFRRVADGRVGFLDLHFSVAAPT
jgi:ubiquinone/menaquinone biosynthesis C-methylase UbiE